MTALGFDVLGARCEPYAAEPTLLLRVRVRDDDEGTVHAVALRCQIRIEPQRRRYGPREQSNLGELFGPPTQWAESLHPFLWTHVATVVPSFTGSTEIDLPVSCTYDFAVASSKYLHGLEDGTIPLVLCFSGMAFLAGPAGFSAVPVSWEKDSRFAMPVAVWRETMDRYFPNSAWIRLDRDTFDTLNRYRATLALPTWDEAILRLVAGSPR